ASSMPPARRPWPNASATPSPPPANRPTSSAPPVRPASHPPFCPKAKGPTSAKSPTVPWPARPPRGRRLPRPRPGARSARPHPLRRAGPVLAPFGAPTLRPVGPAVRLPGIRHDPVPLRLAEPAGVEVAGQGAAQPHRRLQLRRGAGPALWPQRPAQEILRQLLLLPDLPGQPEATAGRLGPGAVRAAVPPSGGVLPGLPRHRLPGGRRRAGPPLPAPPRQGRDQRADVLRFGERQPGAVLRQRQPQPRRPGRRAAAVRRVLARADRGGPAVAVHRLEGDDLPGAVGVEPARHLVRDDKAAWGGDPPPPGSSAGQR